ncbi:hypothetical protein B0H34DRAFT_802136 [Crassisporium funariophilum]|nr:hypothetical protein B0H34DRAFT_802136 [Crassisporium funariophilum]
MSSNATSGPAALPPIPADIAKTTGPLLLAYLLNWGLLGVLSTQVYVYYLAFPRDPSRSKALVYSVYLFEVVQTILLTHTCFDAFAAGFGNLNAINHIGEIWWSVPIMSSIVGFVVQAFYAYRIRILAQSYIVASVIMLLAAIQLGGGIATGIFGAEALVFTNFLNDKTFISTGFWSGGAALADVVIAACMTYYLSRSATHWKPTRDIVRRLIRLIIETGTLTATIAIINLILSLLPGRPAYYQVTSAILGKMYSNTMMVVFNSRMKVGRTLESQDDFSSMVVTTGLQAPHGGGLGETETARRMGLGLRSGGGVRVREEYALPLQDWKSTGGSTHLGDLIPGSIPGSSEDGLPIAKAV